MTSPLPHVPPPGPVRVISAETQETTARQGLRALWASRQLMWRFVVNDLRTRYVGSAIGFFWTVVNPLFELVTYTFVFHVLIGVSFHPAGGWTHYALFLFCGMVTWFSVEEGLSRSTTAITSHGHLIKKVNFPTLVLPGFVVSSALVNQLIRLAVLGVGAYVVGHGLSWHVVFLPLVLVVQTAFVLGLGMLHASLAGFAQADLRRLAAYLSVVQLGLITLGVAAFNPQGLSGSVLHMVSHGVSSCALLLLLGFLYDRRRTLRIEELGGVARPMPVYAVAFGIVMLSLVGLPLSSGFAGEFLILLAAFDVSPWAAIVASLALAVLAAAMFRMYGRVLLGPVTNPENRGLIDLDWRERCVLLVLLVPILGLGVYPDPVLRRVEPAAIRILRQAEARSARVGAAPSAAAPVSPLAWPASWVRPADGLARHDVAGRGG